MRNLLSKKIRDLKPSATIAMSKKARELKAEGKDIISLSLGEPDFFTPDFIKESAIKAIHENHSFYTPVGGFLELKQAISNKFQRDNNLSYHTNQIMVSTGAKQCIYNIIQCLIDQGDEVIIPSPYWVSYIDIVKLAGGVPIVIPTSVENDYKFKAEELESCITNKTKAFLFSSPCNPSGSVFDTSELESIANIVTKHKNITIISDEIYEHIVYDDKNISIASFEQVYNQTVTVNGLAKGFAMTGWRIGYMGGPEWLIKACETLQGQVTSGANSIAQRAAITAINSNPTDLSYMVKEFEKRKDLIVNLAKEIPGFVVNEPKGAFYVFPDISYYFGKTINNTKIENAHDFSLFILENAQVATVAGSAFGSPNCLRVSYAASEDAIKIAFQRIKEILS